MKDLIARLERLDHLVRWPSSEYDEIAEIVDAAGLSDSDADALDGVLLEGSLDAALMLVPDHMRVEVVRRSDGTGYACVWSHRGNRSRNAGYPALALCIAALKARSA